ncbi:MAG: hypothetical protein V3R77_01960, partial [Candidatus Binatia bacterium]
RPRAAQSSRAITIGASPRARGDARERGPDTAPAPTSAIRRGNQRLPLPPNGKFPILVDGQTYGRHRGVVVRVAREGEPVTELVENGGN